MKAKDYSRKYLKRVVRAYINTEMSYSECAKYLRISTYMFEQLIERAIVERVATDAEAYIISAKAQENCRNHGGEGGAQIAKRKYDRLMAQRNEYALTDVEKAFYAMTYSDDSRNLGEIADDDYLPMDLMEDALMSAIKDAFVEDNVVKDIVWKLVGDDTAGKVVVVLDHLIEQRKLKEKEPVQLSIWDT